MAEPGGRPDFSSSRAPARLLALWALPALAVAALTAVLGVPLDAASRPSPEAAVGVLLGLVGQLYAELFLIVWFAAPTAALLAGRPWPAALRALASRGALGVAALAGLLMTMALLLTMLPGLLAAYVNALMAIIFLVVGTIVGAAAAVGLFARWMHAPALAALEGLDAARALDASRALARAHRNFGAALALAVLFALVAGLAAGAGAVAAMVFAEAPLAARALGSWLVLWPGLALVGQRVAARHLAVRHAPPAPSAPTLALRRRPSRCPRCGALAGAPSGAGGPVACPACGLRATLR